MITGFGRLGEAFAAERFGIEPDMITMAKGLTNATVPMSAVGVSKGIHDTLLEGPAGVELFHGYTYSGHPLACAAGLATLEIYAEEGLFERANALAPVWEDALHGLGDRRNVIDIRNIGLMGAVELAPEAGRAGGARLRRLSRMLRQRPDPAPDRRHPRHVAAADRHRGADRGAGGHPGQGDRRGGVTGKPSLPRRPPSTRHGRTRSTAVREPPSP